MIYFDNAATTGKKPETVIKSVNYALRNLAANPGRSGHYLSQNAAMFIYRARQVISEFFGATGPESVAFTLNCTQSINMVLKGVLRSGDHVIVSDLEHNAVMRPLATMNIDFSVATVSLEDDEETVENFRKAIKPNTKMIFCTAASNVIGKILPIKQIGDLCKEKGVLLGVDAAQGAGIVKINMQEMNINYLCIAPHKGLYCPMGVGILIANTPITKTIIEGGTGTMSLAYSQPNIMPEMLESGTVNLPAISAIPSGINFLNHMGDKLSKYENSLLYRLYTGIKDANIIFYTNPFSEGYVPVLSFNVVGYASEKVAEYLNKNGFALRAGLHCAPSAHKKIGTLDCGTVRFSPSIFNNHSEVDALIRVIKNFEKNSKNTID